LVLRVGSFNLVRERYGVEPAHVGTMKERKQSGLRPCTISSELERTRGVGVFAAERFQNYRTGNVFQFTKWGMREWFATTFLMGAFFVSGQIYEYAMLVSEGKTLSSDAYSSVFYVATGFHGLHVTGGLIAFLIVMVRVSKARRFTHQQATTAIVVSYYWHFVDVVWIALFSAIYLIK